MLQEQHIIKPALTNHLKQGSNPTWIVCPCGYVGKSENGEGSHSLFQTTTIIFSKQIHFCLTSVSVPLLTQTPQCCVSRIFGQTFNRHYNFTDMEDSDSLSLLRKYDTLHHFDQFVHYLWMWWQVLFCTFVSEPFQVKYQSIKVRVESLTTRMTSPLGWNCSARVSSGTSCVMVNNKRWGIHGCPTLYICWDCSAKVAALPHPTSPDSPMSCLVLVAWSPQGVICIAYCCIYQALMAWVIACHVVLMLMHPCIAVLVGVNTVLWWWLIVVVVQIMSVTIASG
jgi:hypothetical protein